MTSFFVACNESNPTVETSKTSLPLGQELYALHCASCHGESGDLGLSGAKNLKTSALTISEIKAIVKSGKNGMGEKKEGYLVPFLLVTCLQRL